MFDLSTTCTITMLQLLCFYVSILLMVVQDESVVQTVQVASQH